MRAREFIVENKPSESDMPSDFVDAHQGGTDVGEEQSGTIRNRP